MQYKVSYKDGKSEAMEAASYPVARGTAIFGKAGGGHVAIVSFRCGASPSWTATSCPYRVSHGNHESLSLCEQALGVLPSYTAAVLPCPVMGAS